MSNYSMTIDNCLLSSLVNMYSTVSLAELFSMSPYWIPPVQNSSLSPQWTRCLGLLKYAIIHLGVWWLGFSWTIEPIMGAYSWVSTSQQHAFHNWAYFGFQTHLHFITLGSSRSPLLLPLHPLLSILNWFYCATTDSLHLTPAYKIPRTRATSILRT